jgi:serine protease inhibitor
VAIIMATQLLILYTVLLWRASAAAELNSSEMIRQLAFSNSKLAVDIYKRHTLSADQNIFMSPLSISVVMAMTYLGARGNTMLQMKDALHFGDVDEARLHEVFANTMSTLNKPQQSYKLYLANRLFGEKSYSFLEEFLSAGRKHYTAQLAPVDFR